MPRHGWHFVFIVLVTVTVSAWPQSAHYAVPAASVRDDFSAYNKALDNAADAGAVACLAGNRNQ
jgi:hypothetical protein